MILNLRTNTLSLFLVTLSVLFSCKEGPEQEIPSYLHITPFTLDVSPDGKQGNGEHDFLDAWVYVDGQLIGAFELPVTVPVLYEGEHEVTLFAGIKKNAQTALRVTYPFVTTVEENRKLIPGHIDTMNPVIQYKPTVNFKWVEDFEDALISLEKTGVQTTLDSFEITSDPALVRNFDGGDNQYSAIGHLDTGFQIFEVSSIEDFDLPRLESDIYLEFDFYTEEPLQVGLYPINSEVSQGVPVVLLFETEDNWKRAYISLTEDVNNLDYRGATFRVFFNALTAGEVDHEKIIIDNIKLLHF